MTLEDGEKESISASQTEESPQGPPGSSLEAEKAIEDAEPLKRALKEQEERAERYLANWQRAQADLANYKKRVEQEKEELSRYATAALIAGLVQIIDDFERALKSMPPNLMSLTWVEGVFLMRRKLLAVLETQGLEEIKAVGETFDPNLHQAVLYGEGEEGKVVQEMQKGYKLHGRVIRPALVQVGQGKGAEQFQKEGGKRG